MKLLLDTCVWGGVKKQLELENHDVIWAGDWENDPGDAEILSMAYNQNRMLVTLDKDFGELAIVREFPHCGIIRLVNLPSKQQAVICSRLLQKHSNELIRGAIITAESNRVRIRSAKE